MSGSLFDSLDPCERKHGGNEQSQAAFAGGEHRHANAREQIVEILYHAGPRGLTREEIAGAMGRKLHTISGRFTQLLAEDPARIRESGATRETESGKPAAVLVHVLHLGGVVLGRPSAIRERM